MRWLCCMLTGVMLLGCAAPNGRTPADEEPWVVGDLASSLEVGIAPGEVRLALRLTNTSGSPLSMTFPTAQRYDFVVADEAGRELWRWSADRMFAQVVTEARLAPNETWTMEATWVPTVGPGTYTATGQLMAPDLPVEQQATFELP